MKPIESGCLVIITDSTNPSHLGVSGLAVELEEDVKHLGRYWKVSATGFFHNEKCLRRIDGGKPEYVESEEDRGVLA